MARACVYCRSTGPLTKEHVLNESIGGGKEFERFLQLDLQRNTPPSRKMPQTRDVCGPCNNVRLSWLDQYAARLATTYFRTLVPEPIQVTFEYEFPSLVGVLIKHAFNMARFQDRLMDPKPFRDFIPYLLRQSSTLPVPVTVQLGIVGPSGDTYPELFGGGPINVRGVSEHFLFGRTVMFMSYLFFLIAWRPGVGLATRRLALANLGRLRPKDPDPRAMVELRPSRQWVKIDRACMTVDSWLHQRALREHQFRQSVASVQLR